jgi:hypothetical protein
MPTTASRAAARFRGVGLDGVLLLSQVWFDALLGASGDSGPPVTVDHFRKTDGGEGPPTDLATAMMQVH